MWCPCSVAVPSALGWPSWELAPLLQSQAGPGYPTSHLRQSQREVRAGGMGRVGPEGHGGIQGPEARGGRDETGERCGQEGLRGALPTNSFLDLEILHVALVCDENRPRVCEALLAEPGAQVFGSHLMW